MPSVETDMDKVKKLIKRNFHNYCKEKDLPYSQVELLKDYTERVISPSVFKEE